VKVSDGLDTVLSSDTRTLVVSVVTGISEETDLPKESVLEQNYPNPFNPRTTIKYTIPSAGSVRLFVYNLLGQVVAHIFEGSQSSGDHEIEFDSAGIPSGIYFYRIEAPGFVETRKMVIAK
jgi:hypothetical protein